jgi:hypothetical protein
MDDTWLSIGWVFGVLIWLSWRWVYHMNGTCECMFLPPDAAMLLSRLCKPFDQVVIVESLNVPSGRGCRHGESSDLSMSRNFQDRGPAQA